MTTLTNTNTRILPTSLLPGIVAVVLVSWAPRESTAQTRSTEISVMTYNTHLFGDLAFFKPFGVQYMDDQRKQQIKSYIMTKPATVIALQEVWSGAYANNFKHDFGDTYPVSNFYAQNPHHGKFNKSGLCLLGYSAVTLSSPGYFDYITHCDVDGFSVQDDPPIKDGTGKGYEYGTYTSSSTGQSFGVFITHMVTNASTYPKSVNCCFTDLIAAVDQYCNVNPDNPVILMGDLNIEELKAGQYSGEFVTYIQDIVESHQLKDAFAESRNGQTPGQDPGYTVDSTINTFWRHVNSGGPDQERIDYVFFRNSSSGQTTLSLNSIEVLTPDVIFQALRAEGVDCSDHFPVKAVFTISSD